MSLEEKILKYKYLQEEILKLEEEKQRVYKEILQAFPEGEREIYSESFRLKRYFRLTIKTTVDEARALHATKTEEIVDKGKIKELIQSGVSVPNVTEASYFFIHQKL